MMVFTAFADTAEYLYGELAAWAQGDARHHAALVTGSGAQQDHPDGPASRHGLDPERLLARSRSGRPNCASEGEIDLLIATDCISEGQNLQDCDYLINYDIHWNPVRIIQRFGRIDRIGSPNERIQLVNFWPNMELDEYINLE